jgi:hypothetical protein
MPILKSQAARSGQITVDDKTGVNFTIHQWKVCISAAIYPIINLHNQEFLEQHNRASYMLQTQSRNHPKDVYRRRCLMTI